MAMKLDHDDLNRLIEKISTSDIQEFSLEGEDFKLEIKRNVFDQNQVINNLVSNTSFDFRIGMFVSSTFKTSHEPCSYILIDLVFILKF